MQVMMLIELLTECGGCRMYLFVMQMAQIPLIAIGRVPAIKRNKILVRYCFHTAANIG